MRRLIFVPLLFFISCGTYKSPQIPIICHCDYDSDGDGIMNCKDKCGDTKQGVDVTV